MEHLMTVLNPFKTRDGGTKPLSELFDETYN